MSRRAGLVAAALLLAACGQDDKAAPGLPPAPSAPTASATAPPTQPPQSQPPAPSATAPQAQPPQAPAGTAATVASGDLEKGRQVYLGQCIACHNRDPGKDGPLGPAVKGSPAELVEARVVRGEYPPGYKPKRPSKVMPARPDLAPSIRDLAVYLR